MQARYLKYLQTEDDRDKQMTALKDKDKDKKRSRKQKEVPSHVAAIKTDFRVYNVVIDSDFRDTALYPNANDFVVKLQDAVKMVAALRILKTEFYQPSNSFGYFVLNEAKIPLQLYNVSHAYLYLNGYIGTVVSNDTNPTFLGRIGPGMEMYPAVSGEPTKDPFVYVFRPIEGKLRRFHVKLFNADGSMYPVTNARVVLTLALYCII